MRLVRDRSDDQLAECDKLAGFQRLLCRGELPSRILRRYAKPAVESGEAESVVERKPRVPRVDRSGVCIHRGEQVSTIGCRTCSGTVDVPVFSCRLHEECTLKANNEDVRACSTCGDFTASG